jgi:membrane protein YdbS with pleckstrin-like domain
VETSVAANAGGTAGAAAPEMRPLSPRVVVLWRIPFVVLAVIVAVVTLVIWVAGAPVGVGIVATVVLAAMILLTVWFPGARYRRWGFRVGADQLDIRSGMVVRSEASIPYFRVQHIDIRQGPLERWRKVVSLDISTASPSTAATLPGIDPAEAEQLRTFILARAGLEDGV